MNLIQGQLVDSSCINNVLPKLRGMITETLQKPLLEPDIVINACDKLADSLPDALVVPILEGLGMQSLQAKTQVAELRHMFSRDYLNQRMLVEFGPNLRNQNTKIPMGLEKNVVEQAYPLGVLFHIAAGNMDALPAYSIIEGLLAGNINLLKLPSIDGGLSVLILQKLVEIEPKLAEYIYVFELSSREIGSIQLLVNLSNAVVVWGGDEAVHAIRKITPPNVKIVEWGHKLSFAYVTKKGMSEEKLIELAKHICLTKQLLCSSCQGIYIDTTHWEDIREFGAIFLPILKRESEKSLTVPLAVKAQNTLRLYGRSLEKAIGASCEILRDGCISLTLEKDTKLSASLQFGNLWIKRMPSSQIVPRFHPYKEHLQTVALLCAPNEWEPLKNKFWQAGIVRVCTGADMSTEYCGAAHDGEYPLRRYTRIVSSQQ